MGAETAQPTESDMTYFTFSLLLAAVDKCFRLNVSAIDLSAAMADVAAAYGDVRLVQYSVG